MMYLFFRLPSGLSLLSSPPAWRSMARPWLTSWTATRGCSTGGTTGSTALWTSGPTPRTCPPSALTSLASSSSTTRPGPTDLIQVLFITWRKNIIHATVNNLDNAIPIKSWFNDPSDTALLDLLPVLDALRFVSDVRSILNRNREAQRQWWVKWKHKQDISCNVIFSFRNISR